MSAKSAKSAKSAMHLKSIRLEQFRQFAGKATIDELDSGLCIIAGNNEAGKSTLLQAIRAALFDRYKSSIGKSFRPYGAAVSPSVGITFEMDGIEYHLSKTFSTKKDGGTVLEFTADKGKERKEGDEAEDYLAELLDFEFSTRGGSKPELQGLAGLLWVEQSRAYEAVELTDNSRRRVQSVFEHEMRELLGGDSGDAVHQHITGLWSEYFGKQGNPIGDYRKLSDSFENLSSEVEARQAALNDYEEKVDQLESKQHELQTHRDDKSLEHSVQRLDEAKAAVKQIEGLRKAVQTATSKVVLTESNFKLAEKNYGTRNKAVEDLRHSEGEAGNVELRSGKIGQDLETAESEATHRAHALESLKELRLDKESLLILADDIAQLSGLAAERSIWRDKANEAKGIDKLRREAVSNRDKISLTEDDLLELRELRQRADLAVAKMEAAATSLNYQLEHGMSASLGGQAITGQGTQLLTEPVKLEIEQVGNFLIKPGGEELEVHKSTVTDLNSQQKQKLAALSISTLEAAEKSWRQKQAFSEAADRFQATLEGMAPDGISTLEDQVSTVDAKIATLEVKLGDKKTLQPDADALQGELDALKKQITDYEDSSKEQTIVVSKLREAAAAVGAEKKAVLRQLQTVKSSLDHARLEIADDQLLTAYSSAKADLESSRATLGEAEFALEAKNPAVVDSELERATRVAEDMAREIERLNQETRDLKVELSALGQKGLSEELAEAQGKLALAQIELDVADKQARALDLLKRSLDEALKSAKAVAAQPITEKLVPYLRQLIPEATPLVNEDMVLAGIERSGTHEPFEDLSIGTREQLAVLIRLAYADLLSEANHPVMVILDDALVNSDDERRDRMKAILYQAAKRYQIIILTCHGRDYRDTGGQFIRLEEAAVRLGSKASGY